MNFNLILDYLANSRYVDLVLGIIELVVLYTIIKYNWRSLIGRLFFLYVAIDLLILVIDVLLRGYNNISKNEWRAFVAVSNTIVTFVELGVYYYYFHKIFNKRLTKPLLGGFCFFSLLMVVYLITQFNFLTPRLRYVSDIISVIEFLLILPFCFLFYYNILRSESYFSILDRPSFWLVSGIFIFCTMSIPYYLVSNYITHNVLTEYPNKLLGVLFYYGPFIINFIFITRAMLCKKDLLI